MPLTVEAALQLEVFGRTTVRVVAGHEGLGRAVRWVHPVEIPDVAQFLTGGEMLLTAGLGIGRTPSQQQKFIREISEAGAAVLVIELSGRAFSSMPAALVEEAQLVGLPLVSLAEELPFVEISAQVHEQLVDIRTAELGAFERLNAAVIQLLLASSGPVSFIEVLAHEVGHPVFLEDANHDIVAYSGGTSSTDALVKNWGLHARVQHRPDSGAGTATDTDGCTRRPVVLRGERWGWIHVLHGEDQLGRVESYALDRVADAIAITLLGDRESGVRASQRQSSLVNRLLLGDIGGEQFVNRAIRIGRDLRDRPLVVVFVCKDPDADGHEARTVEATLKSMRVPAVLADIGDHAVAVIGLTRGQHSEQHLVGLLQKEGLRAGVSRVETAPGQLPDAIRQARAAASVAAAELKPTVTTFDGLGVLRLLVTLANGPELERYVHDELGALLAHDANESNELLPTLRTYLACDANKSRAADELNVQRRTLYYRLERLNSLLGKSLEDPDVRQSLGVAIRALSFLESQRR
jgi:purine catabolism regulator